MIDDSIRQIVWNRASGRCEYCHLKQEYYPVWRHQLEHIIPRKHFGSDELANLALACVRCNLGKSSNLSGLDATTQQVVQLFNPRRDVWNDHFSFDGATIVGRTPVGRVTVYVLNMNEDERLRLRAQLLQNRELDT